MKKKPFVILAIFIYMFGFFDGKYQVFFYKGIKYIYEVTGLPIPGKSSKNKDPLLYNNIHTEEEIASFIKIYNNDDVESFRKKLNTIIFGEKTNLSNNKMMQSVQPDFRQVNYRDNIIKQSITINMENNINSILDVYIPKDHNNRLLVYYHGHPGSYSTNYMWMIDLFLEKNFVVMAINLPLQGDNSQPYVDIDNVGKVKFTSHDHFKFIDHPLSYFIYPVIKGINILSNQLNIDDYSIIGLSGGASMTTIVAALDTRIKNTYAVSTQYPLFLTDVWDQDYGDYESTYPDLIKDIGYLNIYILASMGVDRHYTQIFNLYDGDYSGGLKYKAYEKIIKSHVDYLSGGSGRRGDFNIISANTIGHKISRETFDLIYADICKH